MLNDIIALAAFSSHSLDISGLQQTASHLKKIFSPFHCDSIKLPPWKHFDLSGDWQTSELGELLHFSSKRQAPIKILFMGHYDTVYKALFPIREEGDRLHGPGVADMKGGIILMLHLIKWLESSQLKDRISWDVLLSPDEEIGSPGSRSYIEKHAKEKTLGLVFEPSMPSGAIVGKRPGSATYVIEAFGKGGHAGRGAREGKNALVALAEIAVYLASLQDLDHEIVVNPAWMKSGTAGNLIPDYGALLVNIRTPKGELAFKEAIQEIAKKRSVSVAITQESYRPPRPLLTETKHYMSLLGLPSETSFGVSDANLLEAAGLPTLDGLGPTGFHLHSLEEYLLISSLEPRLTKLKQLLASI